MDTGIRSKDLQPPLKTERQKVISWAGKGKEFKAYLEMLTNTSGKNISLSDASALI